MSVATEGRVTSEAFRSTMGFDPPPEVILMPIFLHFQGVTFLVSMVYGTVPVPLFANFY
jgi:hypothetical protein